MLCAGEELRPWLERGIGAALPENAYFIGKVVDGQVVSVAGWANWYGHDAEIFMWSSGTMTRDFLKRIGQYSFGEMGCARITCRVAADNPWKDVLVRLGFVREGCLRGGYDGEIDMLIYGIKKDEYRYGQQGQG